ncbi:MAG TPA: hypothetical protein VKE40_20620 [Gemmataceae bacterium]|nr:hypothetical protein [Gemmataceae bacterium]
MRHLVKNAIASLLRDRRAAKRRPPAGTSPSAPVEQVPDESDARLVRHWKLAVDVATVLAGLPDDARAVAERLMAGDSKTDAARAIGRKRTTIYREVKLMRAAFERASLRDYL